MADNPTMQEIYSRVRAGIAKLGDNATMTIQQLQKENQELHWEVAKLKKEIEILKMYYKWSRR